MIKNYLKKQKGVMVSDAIVAILIILLFVGIITSLMYNIVLETSRAKISSQQIDFTTKIFEYIEKSDFEDVTLTNIVNFVNTQYGDKLVTAGDNIKLLNTPYKIGVTITPYSNLEGNDSKYDFIKLITLEIQTDLKNETYSTKISTLKKATIEEVEEILEN